MHLVDDEAEHSMEMHTPYIAHVFRNNTTTTTNKKSKANNNNRDNDNGNDNVIRSIKLVPILVGALSFENEEKYGEILAPYLSDPENVFVISSDFCHWGYVYIYNTIIDNN